MEESFFSLKTWHRNLRNNRANQVTLSRIISTSIGNVLLFHNAFPPVVLLLYSWNFISDFWDGMLARRNGPTDFGKALDPLADKYLFFSTSYFMWHSFQVPLIQEFYLPFFLKLLIGFDLLLLTIGILGIILELEVASNIFGQWKMGTECFIMGLWAIFYLTPPIRPYLLSSALLLTTFQILFLIATVLAFISLVVHSWTQGHQLLQRMKSH